MTVSVVNINWLILQREIFAVLLSESEETLRQIIWRGVKDLNVNADGRIQ